MGKLVHICFDGNFIDNTSHVFEHFYPDQNIFCILKMKSLRQKRVAINNAVWFDECTSDYEKIKVLFLRNEVDAILLHGVGGCFIDILKLVNPDKKYKVYWVFHGFELYYALGEENLYPLIDCQDFFKVRTWIAPTKYNRLLRRITGKNLHYKDICSLLGYVDYFCFWMYEDYLLLKQFFNTNIPFKMFQYVARYKQEEHGVDEIDFNKTKGVIRIGHSASVTGNHDTIFRLLKKLDDLNLFTKEVPLAYGSVYMRKEILKMGRKEFGSKFVPQLDYVDYSSYVKLLSKVGVAVFGQVRQEASGNISLLLKWGAKVFLRENSPMLSYYKRLGYIVYSVELDMNSLDDLQPLTKEEMLHNAETAMKNRVYYEDFMPLLFTK